VKTLAMFDLDGTLLDSQRGILSALSETIEHFGVTAPPADVLVTHVGASLWTIFEELLGTSDRSTLDAAAAEYRRRYGLGAMFEYTMYDGVLEMIDAARMQNMRVVIATAKAVPYAERVVASTPFAAMIDRVYGSELDGVRTQKEDLLRYVLEQEEVDPIKALMVGDRSHDVNGAHANGVHSIGVLYGYGTREELQRATALAETTNDVITILKQLSVR